MISCIINLTYIYICWWVSIVQGSIIYKAVLTVAVAAKLLLLLLLLSLLLLPKRSYILKPTKYGQQLNIRKPKANAKQINWILHQIISMYDHMLPYYHIYPYLIIVVITYHDVSRNRKRVPVLGWTPQIKSCNRCVTSSVHSRYPPHSISWYLIIYNSTHSHSIELNEVSRCSLRWTWAKTQPNQLVGWNILWLIISAADVPGLLGREVSPCHCALFKQIFFYEHFVAWWCIAAPIALCYSKCTLEAHRPKTCGVVLAVR